MDLNTLIQREGEERARAHQAASQCASIAHSGLADMFRDRIDFRRRAGLAHKRLGPDLRLAAV